MRKALKRGFFIAAMPVLIIVLYLFAALLGAFIPLYGEKITSNDSHEIPVYLTGTMLHQDIAIPLNERTLEQFSFLADYGFPLYHPELKYFIVGWGARDFYTQTADYVDIKFGTVFKAVTGDSAVMHISPSSEIMHDDDIIKVAMSEEGFTHMLSYIEQSFVLSQGAPVVLQNTSFGIGDLFFEGVGHFNIFHPCNVWVSKALAHGGVNSGIWTPTAYSLKLGLYLHN